MHFSVKLFIFLLIDLLSAHLTAAVPDLCGGAHTDGQTIDLAELDLTTWDLRHTTSDNKSIEYNISICDPLRDQPKECDSKHICKYIRNDNQVIGFEPKSVVIVPQSQSRIQSAVVLFEGPKCDAIPALNYTIRLTLTCGPHLEYPQHYMDTKCQTHLIWRTYAVCKEKPIQDEVKCYVYDDKGLRRDLSPLIKTRGSAYKVLSQDQEFYINVCSGISFRCTENSTGACLKTGDNSYAKVGDYRFNTLAFKSSSAAVPYEHLEMTYRTKSGKICRSEGIYYISKTTIRFICPPLTHKRSIDFMDRNPKLVSNLDCDYQIEWLTEYACPRHTISSSAASCQFTLEDHGVGFNLKQLLKTGSNDYYKIENVTISPTKTYDILFNVCGGLGKDVKCGDKKWDSLAVCLKGKNEGSKDKAIGYTSEGTLNFVDNKVLLEYQSKDSDCKFGANTIAETTLIEFVCDNSQEFEHKGIPEFVSYEECTYFILWKTPLVCPLVNPNLTCLATHKNLTFDLSPLRRAFGSEPWTVFEKDNLPSSRHSKAKNDSIYLNVCGVVPKTPKTNFCDSRSSACLTIGGTNTTVNLGRFTSAPSYNEDIGALELVYTKGVDPKYGKDVKSKIVFRCTPGSRGSEPTLIDVDQAQGTYHLEWETSAACPINTYVGSGDCKVYDSYLDYTFDLSPLTAKEHYTIKTDKYEFQINVCQEVKSETCNSKNVQRADGPFGACQVELAGEKRVYSLGKVNSSLTYWNGVINVTLTGGTTYNNAEKTPRKSHIAFICDANAGPQTGPEFDGEQDRAYFFRWYTPFACPPATKTVHCVWDNGSHILDMSHLAMTSGNHFAFSTTNAIPSIYYINICRPLNPVHDSTLNTKICGANSAACSYTLNGNGSTLNLGEVTHPPFTGFDGSVNLIYENGSPCPTNPKKNISTRIKFECDPNLDLSNPVVHEPGSDQTDGEECVYLFEWRTSAVCDVIEPTKPIANNSCVFTDPLTKLSVVLSGVVKNQDLEPHKVSIRNQANYELNLCGLSKPFASNLCSNAAVCYHSNAVTQQTDVNYGLLNSSSFAFDGSNLRLRYSNGSKCTAHSDTGSMSTEIIFRCNPEAVKSEPRLHSSHACVAVFDWETPLVCNLRPPQCSLVADNKFYNLRQLSSMSHSWNTTDKDGNIYYLNVCAQLSPEVHCNGLNSAACKCKREADKKLNCSESLGEPSADELQLLANGALRLTYRSGSEGLCGNGMKAQTQIEFKCSKSIGSPKFVVFDKQKCIYKFSWDSFMACPVSENNDVLMPEKNGYLRDPRLGMYINIGPLMANTYRVNEKRLNTRNETDNYLYVINLKTPQLTETSKCSKSAVCQTKGDSFRRDIGSVDSIKYYLRGHELQIVLESGASNCGRTQHPKNVTTIIKLECSSKSEIGKPVFMYESSDCDYTFVWETDAVCPYNFIDQEEFENISKQRVKDELATSESTDDSKSGSKSGGVWIGVVIVLFFVVTLIGIFTYKQRVRQSLMFRFRRFFSPSEATNHTFHYHQLASNEKDRQREEVVIISGSDAQNRNPIAAQHSGHVPYYSIYDDSDVDLLT